jgi:hypothetical protein
MADSVRERGAARTTRRARKTAFLLSSFAVGVLIAACGKDRPPTSSGEFDGSSGTGPTGGNGCATPNTGCPCPNDGQTVECGKVMVYAGNYVACSMGHRRCENGKWGDCVGEQIVKKASGGTVHGASLGTQQKCPDAGAMSNVCDPYCNQVVDDPNGLSLDGGLNVVDGGLTVGNPPPASPDGGGAPSTTLYTTATGVTSCSPDRNVIANPCGANPIQNCQQDHRCDPGTNQCVWNGGAGWRDTTCTGVDLTIGAPCGPSGSTPPHFPLCNRGTVAVPPNTVIGFNQTNPPTVPDGCAPIGPPDCTINVGPSGLGPGQCIDVNTCPGPGPGGKFIVVNAGQRDIAECTNGGQNRCKNNAAYSKQDGSPGCGACNTCDTRVSGTVRDPGKNVGLNGVTVFQPVSTPLPPIPDNVGGATPPPCDTCASLLPPNSYTTAVNTAIDGTFTLSGVTPGPSVPIVMQSGRWRRLINVPVTACQNNAIANADLTRLPKNRREGDIPKMAFVIGERESLECGLLKFGIDPNEIWPRTGPGQLHRIQMFRSNGISQAAGRPAPPPSSTLWGSGGPLNEYTSLILPCDSATASFAAGDKARILSYLNAGGHAFMDHLTGEELIRNGPAPLNSASVSTWQNWVDPTNPAQGKVLVGIPPKQTMRDWLAMWAPYTPGPGAGFIRSDDPKKHALNPGAASVEWIRGQTTNNWAGEPAGDYSLSFSTEMPVSGPPYCGRIIYNGMHVSQSRVTGAPFPVPSTKQFPTDCDLTAGLTAEEKALEYQLFQLTACQLGGPPPPPPPPPPTPLAPSVTFTRDYEAVCPPSTRVVWRFFLWQASVPAGTSIGFRAATADTQAALPGAPPVPGLPTTVAIGTATTDTTPPGAWDSDAKTVDDHLRTDPSPPQVSKPWLRVYITLNTNTVVAPTLWQWRQVFDCVPAE